VLEAYVCFRPDIGYVQGMSYLAAVMLLYMDTFPAFCCLANLLNTPILVLSAILSFLLASYGRLLAAIALFLQHRLCLLGLLLPHGHATHSQVCERAELHHCGAHPSGLQSSCQLGHPH